MISKGKNIKKKPTYSNDVKSLFLFITTRFRRKLWSCNSLRLILQLYCLIRSLVLKSGSQKALDILEKVKLKDLCTSRFEIVG